MGHRRRDSAAGLLAVAAVALVGSGCAPSSDDAQGRTACALPPGAVAGTFLSSGPPGFERFLEQADEVGRVLGWGGTIDEVADPRGGARVVASLCEDRGHATLIQTSPFRQHEAGFAVAFDAPARQRWTDDLVALVEDHPVAVLAIGVEVNLWREHASAEDWSTFVAWYERAHGAVKAASPTTWVLPTFQYERMVGEHGGLWGPDDAPGTQWEVLEAFPDRDLTAFTTFPHLVRADPADIDDGYYAPISEHVEGPVAFTETGWPSADVAPGYESDLEEQARFVERFFAVAPPARLYVWPFVYDQPVPAPFDALGLREDDGTARPALAAWREHRP